MPLISAFLYRGARNSSSRSSSGGAGGTQTEQLSSVNQAIRVAADYLTFGNDARIHECRERKVGDDKECDDTLYCWNIWMFGPVKSASARTYTQEWSATH